MKKLNQKGINTNNNKSNTEALYANKGHPRTGKINEEGLRTCSSRLFGRPSNKSWKYAD